MTEICEVGGTLMVPLPYEIAAEWPGVQEMFWKSMWGKVKCG